MSDKQLPVRSHLLELRSRLTWSVLAVIAGTIVSFIFHQPILAVLMSPAEGFSEMPTGKPIYTDLTEFIGVAVRVSLLGGVVLSFPFVLFQVVRFVSPGLSLREKKYLYLFVPGALTAFFLGAIFGYKILFPPAVKFLLSFGADVATPYIRIGNYTSLMVTLLFWMGIVFETPIVAFFLSKLGVVTPALMAKNRRYAIVAAFIIGAVITPTFDPVNQALVALPVIVMYEFGILLARVGYTGDKLNKPKFGLNSDKQ